ncbi:MAG: monothiol bacilliredoxin BrxC family protein [Cyclobacteriaceae bacterium]
MSHTSPHWKTLSNKQELDHVIQESRYKPVLILKHDSASPESNRVKTELETNWTITPDQVDVYTLDHNLKSLSREIAEIAGIDDEVPQIVLFADGVTMYDESKDLISFKKIKLALKIVNRTFKWLETRA